MSKLSAEDVITQLRTMQSQIEEVTPLPAEQRRMVRDRLRKHPAHIVEASINVLGVVDNVSQVIGQPLDDVRQLQDEQLRWDAAVDEARTFLRGLEGASLNRRERLAVIGIQAYTIGTQLARNPAQSALVPQLEEIKRLKAIARRTKKS